MNKEEKDRLESLVSIIEYHIKDWTSAGPYDDFRVIKKIYEVICELLGIEPKDLVELAGL